MTLMAQMVIVLILTLNKNFLQAQAFHKRQKVETAVVLKPPKQQSAPGKPSLPASVPKRDSSYSRSLEASLFTALFEDDVRKQVSVILCSIASALMPNIEHALAMH